jgi:mono/diheme cytochrome c family protein
MAAQPRLPYVVAAGLASVTIVAAACASRAPRVQPAPADAAISYTHVDAIFRESCEHCHNEDKAKGGLLLTSFEALTAGGESGPALLPGHGASSLMVQMLEGTLTPRMPYKEDPLSDEQIALIRRWIDAGAPGPAPGAGAAAARKDVELPVVKPTVAVTGAAAAVAFDPSTGRLVVGGYKTAHVMTLDGRKWSRRLEGHADLVRALAFSPDGRRLAVAGGPSGRFGEIKVWDLTGSEPKPVATIKGHTDTILAVAFSADGAIIASASYDKLVKLWDVATGAERATLKEHSDAVYAVAFVPGGTHVLSAAGDRTIKVWDLQTGKRVLTISDPLDAVYSLAVHPSGQRIAAAGADRMIRTWSLNAGAPVPTATLTASMFAHGDSVLGLAYSPDGSTLVSAGADRVIKVWDAATLREKQLLEPQPDWVLGLALSGDGRWLAAGRYDGTVGLYALAAGASGEHFVVPR